MSQFNIIAVLGFYLICSPQAFGQDARYLATHLAIEKQIEKPVFIQKTTDNYILPKRNTRLSTPLFKNCLKIQGSCATSFHNAQPIVVVNFKQFTRPKIIEEA